MKRENRVSFVRSYLTYNALWPFNLYVNNIFIYIYSMIIIIIRIVIINSSSVSSHLSLYYDYDYVSFIYHFKPRIIQYYLSLSLSLFLILMIKNYSPFVDKDYLHFIQYLFICNNNAHNNFLFLLSLQTQTKTQLYFSICVLIVLMIEATGMRFQVGVMNRSLFCFAFFSLPTSTSPVDSISISTSR